MLANVNLATDLKLLALYGRVIVIGNRGEITINPRELMARRAMVRGFTLWAATEAESAEIHAAIAAGLENGTLRPIVGKEFPLKDAPKAHQEVMAPGAFGKIVSGSVSGVVLPVALQVLHALRALDASRTITTALLASFCLRPTQACNRIPAIAPPSTSQAEFTL